MMGDKQKALGLSALLLIILILFFLIGKNRTIINQAPFGFDVDASDNVWAIKRPVISMPNIPGYEKAGSCLCKTITLGAVNTQPYYRVTRVNYQPAQSVNVYNITQVAPEKERQVWGAVSDSVR